jgi:hypothetical protein
MKTWEKYTLLNASMLTGFVVSLYVLPPSTQFWPVALAFLIFLGSTNYALFRRLRQTQNSGTKRTDKSVMIVVLVLVIADVALSRLLHMDQTLPIVIVVLILLTLAFSRIFDKAD